VVFAHHRTVGNNDFLSQSRSLGYSGIYSVLASLLLRYTTVGHLSDGLRIS
jgi:hypothetical protein